MKATELTDKKTGRFVRQFEYFVKECPCGSKFEVAQWRLDAGRGLYCSKPCMYIYRNANTGEKHYKWSGEKPKYSALHKWIAKEYGQPMKCEWCEFQTDNKYQIHWANLTGNYKRERDDWARLCAKCHYNFDRKGIKYV